MHIHSVNIAIQFELYTSQESTFAVCVSPLQNDSVVVGTHHHITPHSNPPLIITLCAYVQQGYAFGHVGLCICIYVAQKTGCLMLTHRV